MTQQIFQCKVKNWLPLSASGLGGPYQNFSIFSNFPSKDFLAALPSELRHAFSIWRWRNYENILLSLIKIKNNNCCIDFSCAFWAAHIITAYSARKKKKSWWRSIVDNYCSNRNISVALWRTWHATFWTPHIISPSSISNLLIANSLPDIFAFGVYLPVV